MPRYMCTCITAGHLIFSNQFLACILYIIHYIVTHVYCTLCRLHVYTVHCNTCTCILYIHLLVCYTYLLYIVQCTLHCNSCIVYTLLHMYTVHCNTCTCILYIHLLVCYTCILYIVQCTLHCNSCIVYTLLHMYIVHCALHLIKIHSNVQSNSFSVIKLILLTYYFLCSLIISFNLFSPPPLWPTPPLFLLLLLPFSPDGQYVGVGASDGTIHMWEAMTGRAHKTKRDSSVHR